MKSHSDQRATDQSIAAIASAVEIIHAEEEILREMTEEEETDEIGEEEILQISERKRCTVQFVTNVETIVNFLSSLLAINRFFAAIVLLRKISLKEVELIIRLISMRLMPNWI